MEKYVQKFCDRQGDENILQRTSYEQLMARKENIRERKRFIQPCLFGCCVLCNYLYGAIQRKAEYVR